MGKQKDEEGKKNRAAILLEERKKAIYNLVLLFAAAFVVLIGILTMAWFTKNRDNNTNGMGVTVLGMPFELKTSGYYGYYDDYLPEEYARIEVNRDTAGLPPSGTSGVISTANGASIQWLITSDTNTKNYVTSDSKDSEKGIRPGTSGEMKFWVVSKGTETISIRFKLSVVPYKTNYKLDQSGNIITDENGIPQQNAPISIANDVNYTEAINFLKSHVLFFKKRNEVKKSDNSFSHYTYSDLIELDTEFNLVYDTALEQYVDTLTFTLNGNEYQDAPFSIYWVWPETLAEVVLPENMQNNGKHALSPNGEMFNEFKKNPALYLKGYNAISDTEGTQNTNLTQAIIYQFYSKLSLEYNNADQEIGDNIGYFLLQLFAIG